MSGENAVETSDTAVSETQSNSAQVEQTLADALTEAVPKEAAIEGEKTATDTKVETKDAPKVEEPAKETVEEKKEDDKFSRRFAELSRRERETVKREQELKEKEKRYQEYEKKLKEAQDDPLAFLEAHALDYDKITDHILQGGKKDPHVTQLEKELKAHKEELQREKEEKARETQERALADFKAEQKTHVQKASDKYALVNALGEFDLVFEVAQEHFNETKEVLSHDDAAQKVEEYLESKVKSLKGLSKLQTLLAVHEGSEPVKNGAKASQASTSQSTTLSNEMALDAVEPNPGHLSDEESLARAARALKWND